VGKYLLSGLVNITIIRRGATGGVVENTGVIVNITSGCIIDKDKIIQAFKNDSSIRNLIKNASR
jgi:hypothetical protein